MISAKSQRLSGKRSGATAVEFAIVTPFVFAAFFGAFEFCRVAMVRHAVDNAVYEGARQAIIPGGTAEAAERKTSDLLAVVGVTNASISVTPSNIAEDTRDVTVGVAVNLDQNSFVAPLFFQNKQIVRQITLRREGQR